MKCDEAGKRLVGLQEGVKYKCWESSSYFQYNERKNGLKFWGRSIYMVFPHHCPPSLLFFYFITA
nr:MAG TPA: hypothetical protein [Caudoviricetes sp.]